MKLMFEKITEKIVDFLGKALDPVRIFIALMLAVIVWFAPALLRLRQDRPLIQEALASNAAVPTPPACGDGTEYQRLLGFWECRNYDKMAGCVNMGRGRCKMRVNFECWKYYDACVVITASPPTISGEFGCAQPGENGWCLDGLSLNLTASDPKGLSVNISGDIDGELFACPDGNTSCSEPITTPGTGTGSYKVTSSSGLFTEGSAAYKLDGIPPQITESVTGIIGSNEWYVSDATFSADAQDSDSGIQSFVLEENAALVFSPTILGEGIHPITMTARDNAGNLTVSTVTINVDMTAPVMEVSRSGTVGLGGWYISDVGFQITATDVVSGPQSGEYRIDDGLWQTGMSFTVSGDGVHTVEYRIFDQAGNVAIGSEMLKIDTTVPALTFLAPSQNTVVDKTVQVTGSALDPTSGLDAVEVSANGGLSWARLASADWSYDWDVSALSNGSYFILARASDTAGNISPAARLNLLVDGEGPFISLPDSWTIDLAGELKITRNRYDVGSVAVSITDSAGIVMSETRYLDGKIPAIIWWSGRYHGEQQPVGEYSVEVIACDTHNVCSMARSAIIIPFFEYIFKEAPIEPPRALATVPPVFIPTSTHAPVYVPEPLAIPKTPPPLPKHTGAALTLFVTAGFSFLFLSGAIFDSRPRAMHSLAGTIRKTIIQRAWTNPLRKPFKKEYTDDH